MRADGTSIDNVYRSYERGNEPDQFFSLDEEGRVEESVSRRASDSIHCFHLRDNHYLCTRVEPKTSKSLDRQKPWKGMTDEFEGCNLQFLTVEIPELRDSETVNDHRLVMERCRWNAPDATRLRRVHSVRSLHSQWNEQYRKISD